MALSALILKLSDLRKRSGASTCASAETQEEMGATLPASRSTEPPGDHG
jgi:hypothetical protein